MDPSKWIDLILLTSTAFCAILFIKRFLLQKTLLDLYFALSAIILFIPYSLHIMNVDTDVDLFGWAKLIAIITYISGLLVLIRESKPVFARFPQYLTALPFMSLLFFPFMIDSYVIKDLLNAIYQGGALVVTGLIITLNFARTKGRRYYLIGIGSAIAAYIAYWVYFNRFDSDYTWISEMLLAVAIVITSYKFIKSQKEKTNLSAT